MIGKPQSPSEDSGMNDEPSALRKTVTHFLLLRAGTDRDQRGHGADLQGAAVPVQLSLTLVAGYLGVLYWSG